MKKTLWIVLAIVAALILAAAAGLYLYGREDTGGTVGTALVCPDGTMILIIDGNFPVTASNLSGKDDLWEDVSTGDKIRITHDGIRETYPGQTGVYTCTVLEQGSEADIPNSMIADLTAYGWLGSPKETGNTLTCSHGAVQISLGEMEGWEYETIPYTEGCHRFGIQFRPAGQEGYIQVMYHPGGFGVCGTGLTTENVGIGSMGTYDDRAVWDFISFQPPLDDFAVLNDGIGDWWLQYRSDAFAILQSMTLTAE